MNGAQLLSAYGLRPASSGSTLVHTGDLGCDAVDIEAFKRDNRIPLLPRQWQVWRLFRTTRDNPTPSEELDTARAVVLKWFASGLVDQITACNSDASCKAMIPPDASGRENVERIASWQALKSPIQLAAPRAAKAGERAYEEVWVKFAYRGSDSDMPWPVWKQQLWNPWCPSQCDWMVAEAYRILTPEPLPPESGVPEIIRPDVDAAKKTISDAADSFTFRALSTAILVGAGFALAMYLGARR